MFFSPFDIILLYFRCFASEGKMKQMRCMFLCGWFIVIRKVGFGDCDKF